MAKLTTNLMIRLSEKHARMLQKLAKRDLRQMGRQAELYLLQAIETETEIQEQMEQELAADETQSRTQKNWMGEKS